MSLRNRKREKSLDQLFKRYIVPTTVSINTYREQQEERSKFMPYLNTSKWANSTRSFSSLGKLAVITHEDVLYPTADTSKEVLIHNRATYKEMTSTLRQLEWIQFKKQFNSIEAQKTKLSFFKGRVRKSAERICTF